MKKSKTILASTMIAGAFALQGTASNAQTGSSNEVASTETIRPFQVHIPQADLDDLRRRVLATKWPARETVTDESQGVQLATMQKLASYWANRLRLAKSGGETECLTAIHDHDRWSRYSFYSCSFETQECIADHHHPWLAGLDHRAAEDHRPTYRSCCLWRKG